MKRGQTSPEYLILLSAILIIIAIAVLTANKSVGGINEKINATIGSIHIVPKEPTVYNVSVYAKGKSWIYWTWSSSNVDHISVYLNNSFKINTTFNHYNATGLSPDTTYEVELLPIGYNGLPGNWVNTTETTSSKPEITNLTPEPHTTWIKWTWTPSNVEHSEVYLNGSYMGQVKDNYYIARGLIPHTWYEIRLVPVGYDGSKGTEKTNTAKTTGSNPCGCWDGYLNYTCGDTVYTNCTLNCDLTTSNSFCFKVAKDNVVIKGNGHSITGPSSGKGIIINGETGVLHNVKVVNVVIKDFEDGIYVGLNATNTTLENNELISNKYGIHLDDASNATVKENKAHNNDEVGILLDKKTHNVSLIENEVYNNEEYGIKLEKDVKMNKLQKNYAYNNNQDGIYSTSTFYNLLTENEAYNTGSGSQKNGIHLVSASNLLLTGNKVHENKDNGILLDSGTHNVTLKNNEAYNNKNNGIMLNGVHNITLTENKAYNTNQKWKKGNQDYGIHLSGAYDINIIDNNHAHDNTRAGVYLESMTNSDILVMNNNISHNGAYGVLLDDISGTNITDNRIQENDYYDVFITASKADYCNNVFDNSNNIGSGGRLIKYFNWSVFRDGATMTNITHISELVLCNADSSKFRNINVDGSNSLTNNGVIAILTDNTNFTNVNSSGNYDGYYIYRSNRIEIGSSKCNSNRHNGFNISNSNTIGIIDVTANTNKNDGVHVVSSNTVGLVDVYANNNHDDGIDVTSSKNVGLLRVTANDNWDNGVYIGSNKGWCFITNSNANSNTRVGVYLYNDNNVEVNKSYINNNGAYGLYLRNSKNIKINNNHIQENEHYDVFITASKADYCNNVFDNSNNIGSGGRLIKYFHETGDALTNVHISELILCNADSSSFTNVNVDGSDSKYNNGVIVIQTSDATFDNVDSSENYDGYYIYNSGSITVGSSECDSNGHNGFNISSSGNVKLLGITANGNTYNGIYGYKSSIVIESNSYIESNSNDGVHASSSDVEIYHSQINSNSNNGMYINGDSLKMRDVTLDDNTKTGIYIAGSCSGYLDDITAKNSEIGVHIKDNTKTFTLNYSDLLDNTKYGLYLDGSSNIKIEHNSITNKGNGTYIYKGSKNTLTGNTITGNSYGLLIRSSSENMIQGNTIKSNKYGIYIRGGSGNKIINKNNITGNDYYGLLLEDTSGNTIKDNKIKDNTYFDVFITASKADYCKNSFSNNEGTGNLPIKYLHSKVTLANETLSELILCDADGSTIFNVTVNSTKQNNGILLVQTDNANLTNVTSDGHYGLYFDKSSRNNKAFWGLFRGNDKDIKNLAIDTYGNPLNFGDNNTCSKFEHWRDDHATGSGCVFP